MPRSLCLPCTKPRYRLLARSLRRSPTSLSTGLRSRKQAQTRRNIQEAALRLFSAGGFDATTVQAIAKAADVSHMTFFRYFPTKEDVVLSDDYDPMIAEMIGSRPADEPAVDSIRQALVAGLTQVYAVDRAALLTRTRPILGTPALRARLWEQQSDTADLMAGASSPLGRGEARPPSPVTAAACLAVVTTAILAWAELDGVPDLPTLVDDAIEALRSEAGLAHPSNRSARSDRRLGRWQARSHCQGARAPPAPRSKGDEHGGRSDRNLRARQTDMATPLPSIRSHSESVRARCTASSGLTALVRPPRFASCSA